MNRNSLLLLKKHTFIVTLILSFFILSITHWLSNGTFTLTQTSLILNSILFNTTINEHILLYRRQSCSCTRPLIKQNPHLLTIDGISSSLCSQYSTLRGFHQRIISISMYGPRDNALFALNTSINFLRELIVDMKNKYPDWILRIYHDVSIKDDVMCSIECSHNNVDFCNTSSLGNLGSISNYIPAKIWRFLPVGDKLVDIMSSRDLDSPLTQRELDAVNHWISTNKSWHAMRDHPMHYVPMLGGMWGFRPEFNRTFANDVLRKILDPSLVSRYGGRGDQTFLTDHVWPHIQEHVIAHDSFLCTLPYGINSRPFPTRRQHPSNDSGCFIGCVRPCCTSPRYPFGDCPLACRPKNHTDWTKC